jgi:hypothetical protein
MKSDATRKIVAGNKSAVASAFADVGCGQSVALAPPQPPLRPALESVGLVTNSIHFTVTGSTGQLYIVYVSSNLSNWTPALTNAAPIFVSEPATNSLRFYRAGSP